MQIIYFDLTFERYRSNQEWQKSFLSKETIKKCNTEYRYNCSNISSEVPIAFFLNAVTFNIDFWSLNFHTGLQRTITVPGRSVKSSWWKSQTSL